MAGVVTERLSPGDTSADHDAQSRRLSSRVSGHSAAAAMLDGAAPMVGRSSLDVLSRMPGAAWIAGRIGMSEFRRRLLHMLPGLLPFALWAYPHERVWELPVRVWVVGLVMLIVTFGMRNFGSMLRNGESGAASVLSYGFCVLGSLAIAPAHPEFTLIVVVLLAFGDGSATLGGLLLGGPRLFWNRNKSWSGLACFFACGTLMAAVVYWGEVGASWSDAFLLGAGVALCAALAESLPVRLDDNLRVGIASLMACFAIVEHNFQLLVMMSVASIVGLLLARKFQTAGQGS
jgi:phytol kinase